MIIHEDDRFLGKFSIVEDIFRISLGVLRQGFFSYSLGVNIMIHLHLDKFEIKSDRIDNRTCIGSILDHRRADNDGTMDKRKGP